MRRWSAEHRRQLRQWSEDQKYEQRPRPTSAERREAESRKYRDLMNSVPTRSPLSFAHRRRFRTVSYDDTERKFCEGFPWYMLRTLISGKVAARGLKLPPRRKSNSRDGVRTSRSHICSFAPPLGAARSPAGTFAEPAARERLANVRDIHGLPWQPRRLAID